MRAVLRCEGWYVTARGEPMARAIIRYHVYRNTPWVQVDHTFVITRDNDQVWYREIGIGLPLAPGDQHRAVFGLSDAEPAEVEFANSEEAFALQAQYPIYNREQSVCLVGREIDTARRESASEGWAYLGNGDHRLLMALPDFPEQFPKEYCARPGGLTLKLWSGRDGRVLDYNCGTLVKDWWQEWFQEVPHMDPKRILEPMARTGQSPEAVPNLIPNAVGVARTHEFYFGYTDDVGDVAETAELGRALLEPPLAWADPKWMTRVDPRVMIPMSWKGEGGADYEVIERYISSWFDMRMAMSEVFPMTGWYEWGQNACGFTYGKHPDGEVFLQWYRLSIFVPYQLSRNMLYAWVRSGDRKYLEGHAGSTASSRTTIYFAGAVEARTKSAARSTTTTVHPSTGAAQGAWS